MPAIFPLFAILVVFIFISLHASTNQKPKRRRISDFERSSSDNYGGDSSRKDYARDRRSCSSSRNSGSRDGRGSSRDRY